MFNLPFPTDSLYKFCFMFGLALMGFSMYIFNKSVNTYQYKTNLEIKKDSLKARLKSKEYLSFDIQPTIGSNDGSYAIDSIENSVGHFKGGGQLMRAFNASELENNPDNGRILKITESQEQNLLNYEMYVYAYKAALYFGAVIFLYGAIMWYIKIQRPQDKILILQLQQLTDTVNQTAEPSIGYGRKHFEPKILPRPEARNLR